MNSFQTIVCLLVVIVISVFFSMYTFFKKEPFRGLGRGYGIEGVGSDVDYSSNMNVNRFNANVAYSNTVNLAATKPKGLGLGLGVRNVNSDDEPLFFSLPKQI